MSYRRRPSLLGAVLWIGIGVLFLLSNFGRIELWPVVGSYWPVLLIFLGLGKVIEFLLKKEGIAVRFGELFGMFFVLLIGFAVIGIHDTHIGRIGRIIRDAPFQFGDFQIHPGRLFGESHIFSEEATYPLERPMAIRIQNSNGSVSIAPGSDGEIRVQLKKVVYGSESEAKAIADKIHLIASAERNGEPSAPLKPEAEPGKRGADAFVVRTNREDLSSRGDSISTEMVIYVPKNSQLQVRNSFGGVRVTDINGKLDLSTTHEKLDVQDCTGEFILSTRYAESRLANLVGNVTLDGRGKVYLDGVKGNVNVTNENSPMEILNVDGSVSVASRDGNTRIDSVSKPVVINASGANLTIRNLKSSLKITKNFGTAIVSDVDSDVKLESRSAALILKNIRNIEIDSNSDNVSADDIENFTLRGRTSNVRLNSVRSATIQATLTNIIVNNLSGDCNITDEYAKVSVSAQSLLKIIRIKNRNGGIDLWLPQEASCVINATASNGRIQTNHDPGLGIVQNEGSTAVLKSTVKSGGPAVVLETEYANIRIARRGGS
jgi:hypothetical protein